MTKRHTFIPNADGNCRCSHCVPAHPLPDVQRGDTVIYPWPKSTPGHEPPQTKGVVTHVYKDGTPSVKIQGSPSIWPISRIKKV